ncbi:MAG: hypothetical protein HQL55_16910 [Magnetococcales bacterium]|nr:hypothetical protein [Magnetococcales bacterium]
MENEWINLNRILRYVESSMPTDKLDKDILKKMFTSKYEDVMLACLNAIKVKDFLYCLELFIKDLTEEMLKSNNSTDIQKGFIQLMGKQYIAAKESVGKSCRHFMREQLTEGRYYGFGFLGNQSVIDVRVPIPPYEWAFLELDYDSGIASGHGLLYGEVRFLDLTVFPDNNLIEYKEKFKELRIDYDRIIQVRTISSPLAGDTTPPPPITTTQPAEEAGTRIGDTMPVKEADTYIPQKERKPTIYMQRQTALAEFLKHLVKNGNLKANNLPFNSLELLKYYNINHTNLTIDVKSVNNYISNAKPVMQRVLEVEVIQFSRATHGQDTIRSILKNNPFKKQ